MRSLAELIQDAYELFAPYTLGPTLCVCKACCVTDAEERVLLTTPLREVSSDALFRGYYESACYHSDQERWEMKHFLPRVLELVSAFDFPCFTPEVTFTRLDFDQPAHWPQAEQKVLTDFALAFTERCLTYHSLPDGSRLADMLLMFGIAYFDLAPLLHAWLLTDTPPGLNHFINLLVDEIAISARGAAGFSPGFTTPEVDAQLSSWLADPAVRATWAGRLERVILADQLPNDQAARASLAYEVLTTGLA